MKRRITSALCTLIFLGTVLTLMGLTSSGGDDYIKYMEFNVTYDALEKAMNYDIESQNEKIKIDWVEVLAYLGAKYGGDFSSYKASHMDELVERLKNGEKIGVITRGMKYYDYYEEAYRAVLDEFLGTYIKNGKEEYGLKVYSPIADSFYYTHYDDFGASRSYGYKRNHLGHDLMASTGTPVIAIESGIVEAMGWNQYGGWRIGIRSFDGKRYYYYAHLRQNRPYHCDLFEGKVVKAGDVIGYVGRTGYSSQENTNGIEVSHLHYGMQIIFDESQKEGNNEIWIDMYAITKLLYKHRQETFRNSETKEFYAMGQPQ